MNVLRLGFWLSARQFEGFEPNRFREGFTVLLNVILDLGILSYFSNSNGVLSLEGYAICNDVDVEDLDRKKLMTGKCEIYSIYNKYICT